MINKYPYDWLPCKIVSRSLNFFLFVISSIIQPSGNPRSRGKHLNMENTDEKEIQVGKTAFANFDYTHTFSTKQNSIKSCMIDSIPINVDEIIPLSVCVVYSPCFAFRLNKLEKITYLWMLYNWIIDGWFLNARSNIISRNVRWASVSFRNASKIFFIATVFFVRLSIAL